MEINPGRVRKAILYNGVRDIPGLKITVPALKGQMGKYRYYSFNIDPLKLLKIAYISHRRKMDSKTLVSYQRMIRKKRLNKIRKFIHEACT